MNLDLILILIHFDLFTNINSLVIQMCRITAYNFPWFHQNPPLWDLVYLSSDQDNNAYVEGMDMFIITMRLNI